MIRLVQIKNEAGKRYLGYVNETLIVLLNNFSTAYEFLTYCIENNEKISTQIAANKSSQTLDYEEVWAGKSNFRLLPAIDHPSQANLCMVSGTGLTHKASAANRDNMHAAEKNNTMTDSMKVYLWGEEGGKPQDGKVGAQPEWFYKGNGSVLRAHGEALEMPAYADDGGEEPEIAGIYINNSAGMPIRVGFAIGNEFSDHIMERKNYLYLAPSKIRTCAIGPELVIGKDFEDFSGKVVIKRAGETIWQKDIKTGEKNMAHGLANLEYHHFKYQNHRIPQQIHVHFFGTGAFSFGDGIVLNEGDTMEIHWEGMGKPLVNSFKKTTENLETTVQGLAI